MTAWQYAGEYSLYDPTGDAALRPGDSRAHSLFEDGELVGFCTFGDDGRVPGYDYDDSAVDVGAGRRPDRTGQGSGGDFLRAVVTFARTELGLSDLRATIAAWNLRALAAARAAGFENGPTFTAPDGHSFQVLTNRVRSES